MSDLQLDTLEAKGLIRLATLDPELAYLFRHELVKDTAYDSLLKQERRELHRLVGNALEDLYPDRGDLAAVLAMHFENAGDTEHAITYLMIAAQFAFERNAVVEAFDLYARAAALLPPQTDDEDRAILRRRVEIGLGQARTGFAFQERNERVALIEKAVRDAETLGDLQFIGDTHLYNALHRQFEGELVDTSPELRKSLDRVTEIARELNDPTFEALPKSIIGITQVFSGSMREGIANLEASVPLLADKRDFVGSSFAGMALGVGYARLGDFKRADEAVQRAKETAEGGDIIARIDTLIGASMVEVMRGDLEAAIPIAKHCSDMAEDAGATACVVGSNLVLGESLMRKGQFEGAKIAIDRSHDVAEVTNQKMFKPAVAAYRRSIAASMGEFDLYGRTFEEALVEAQEMGDKWVLANIYWRRAETERIKDSADRDQMLADYEAADGEFAAMGARPNRARVLRDWGHVLIGLDGRDDGLQKLREALALFDDLGLERESNEVKSELTSAA